MSEIVGVKVDPYSALSSGDAREVIERVARNCGAPAWTIVQSFEMPPVIESWNGALSEHFDTAYNGRIFGPDAEARWIREGTTWHVWFTSERADGERMTRQVVPYYLWGIFEHGRFAEDRIPGAKNLHISQSFQNGDRACIKVALYSRIKPDEALDERTGLSDLMDELNQPYTYCHRFMRLE